MRTRRRSPQPRFAARHASQIDIFVAVGAATALALPSTLLAAAAAKPFQHNRDYVQSSSARARWPTIGACTMAAPLTHATVEAEIANAGDFCELVSHALASDVFRAPVLVTSGRLWHYDDATLSCRLRYRATRYRMTVHNSAIACRWLKQLAPGWSFEVRIPGVISPSRVGQKARAAQAGLLQRERRGSDQPSTPD